MRMLPERNSPNILKNEKTLQRTSPAVHMTVAFQPISRGIIRKVTRRSAIACGSGKTVSQKIYKALRKKSTIARRRIYALYAAWSSLHT